ncbi:LysR family transcriptional regulator [Marinomonas flavescens]|uniref:LysR family transcriptional regulator n=1 Tax=Marinomonas flavescens TaxID=2529379 RepID=UPI00105622F8|nr:LysR family transcriptional regulator [Marinomonas flavescens]
MAKYVEPDQILVKMPSLTAVKSFVAAAKYQNFTRASESLCVTQAAISRQIKELETFLGVDLFKRAGRTVELTEAGTIFYDAAYLSFVNIAQAAQRIKSSEKKNRELTICCSPAFSALWLSSRLPDFISSNPEVDINIVTTSDFLHMEPGVHPDVFINKVLDPREGFHSIPLFYDLIYPVCSPLFLEENSNFDSLEDFKNSTLLNLSPYGRSQVAEHVDWGVWFNRIDSNFSFGENHQQFSANDYNMIVQMALSHKGIFLGWNHLVAPMIEQGLLVKVGNSEVRYREKVHYFTYLENHKNDELLELFKHWILKMVEKEPTNILAVY